MTRLPLVDRVEYLRQACCGRRVLHLGCTNWPYTAQSLADGSLLHLQLRAEAAELWGLDADQKGLDLLASQGFERLLRGDLEMLEKLEPPEPAAPFDVIVAGEIVEHLSNPGQFLAGVRRLMTPETRLILTTVNAYCGMRAVVYALRGRGGRVEPVHPDHVAYYSYATLRHLLGRHGFAVHDFLFYDLGPEHRPHNRWWANRVNDLCVAIAPQLADGLIVECTLA